MRALMYAVSIPIKLRIIKCSSRKRNISVGKYATRNNASVEIRETVFSPDFFLVFFYFYFRTEIFCRSTDPRVYAEIIL